MLKMADDKSSESTSEIRSPIKKLQDTAGLVEDNTSDAGIFAQRAVTEATYFSRDFGENDTNDDCPNFSIYSRTSLGVCKDIDISAKPSPPRIDPELSEECDENLVQMTDDEGDDKSCASDMFDDEREDTLKSLKQSDINNEEHEPTISLKSPEIIDGEDQGPQEDIIKTLDESEINNDEPDNKNILEHPDEEIDHDILSEAESKKIENNIKSLHPLDLNDDELKDDVKSLEPAELSELAQEQNIQKQINVECSEEIQSPSCTDGEQDGDNIGENISGEISHNVSDSTSSMTDNKLNDSGDQSTGIVVTAIEKLLDKQKSPKKKLSLIPNKKVFLELYDDSDWDEWTNEKTDEEKSVIKPNAVSDIDKLTESISDVEDDRGYTPCQDELIKARNLTDDEQENITVGIGGLETELISEEEGNIFTDDIPKPGLKQKIVESVLEDGEIIEKHKTVESLQNFDDIENIQKEKKTKSKDKDKENRKTKSTLSETFKKISSKDRNYRDKDKKRKTRSESRDKRKYSYRKKKEHSNRKKEKRKDLEWYDVRNMITKKRGDKDEYGRERRPTPSRSRSRGRVRSESRTRSRRTREGRNRSRGRSGYGRYHNSRSKSRSLSPSRSSSTDRRRRKRASRSARRRSRSISRSYNNPKSKHQSKSKSPVRRPTKAKRRRSISYQRDWTPSWSSANNSISNSPTNKMLPSPSWTPPLRENMNNAQNLTVIVNNKEVSKKKKEKRRKTDPKQKDSAIEKTSKKRRRELSVDQPSKEVFASGDNILVSVSFNKNKTTELQNSTAQVQELPKRKKNQDVEVRKRTTKGKDKQARANRNRRLDLANRKPIAIIDLDASPFKEMTPSPKAIIVLTDSDSEEKEQLLARQERIHKELGSIREESQPESPTYNTSTFTNNTGPKTPPEPQVNFSIQLKPAPKLRNVNLLYDQEEENENDDIEQNHISTDNHVDDGPHKGPNTPPEPPNSPPSSPDAYDPFEPTKSASQSPNVLDNTPNTQTVVDKQPEENNFDIQMHSDTAALGVPQVPAPEEKQNDTVIGANTVEKVLALLAQRYNSSPEKNVGSSIQNDKTVLDEAKSQTASETKVPSPEVSKNGVTVLSNVLLQTNMLTNVLKSTMANSAEQVLLYTSGAPVSSTPLVTTINPSRTNLFNSANNMQNTNSSTTGKTGKSQARPSPIKSNPIKPMVKTAVIKPGIRPYMTNKVHKPSKHDGDGELESPYSPGSDDFDDLFEPPPTDASKSKKKSTNKSPTKKVHDFDNLFMSPSYKPSITSKGEKRMFGKKHRKTTKSNKTQVGVKIDDDQLKVLEELPSSAVEMQVKDKFLKKLNRQERVVEEVKLVLKPHYAKKHVTKEQYKDILRRAVPKICHNRSGEINPQRIHKLIEAYVKKARYSRKALNN